MRAVGDALRAAGVTEIYLAHGTFVGSDPLGVLTGLARIYPAAAEVIGQYQKRAIDRVAGDTGNFTDDYARLFESSINRPATTHIPVRRFLWSSRNNHIGRADAAVRLIDQLAGSGHPAGRVLIWGHSHAGNALALVTNLLAADAECRQTFFDAARSYYRWPLLGWVDIDAWSHVARWLAAEPDRLAGTPLDIVTLGTPIRYGWDTGGCAGLMHFVHHRPAPGLPDYRAPFPPTAARIVAAADGDYVAQLGIAGTNTMPGLLAWRTWLADRRLGRLLQDESAGDDLLMRLRAGRRVAADGTTLLVDYASTDETIARQMAGHAVYTRSEWLLFHAEQVVRQFYGHGAPT